MTQSIMNKKKLGKGKYFLDILFNVLMHQNDGINLHRK